MLFAKLCVECEDVCYVLLVCLSCYIKETIAVSLFYVLDMSVKRDGTRSHLDRIYSGHHSLHSALRIYN